jgi:NAD(P)H-flavin reductase
VFRILEKREIAPNIHELVIEAPEIAKRARAGQFVILMSDERSERVPFTLCDWDPDSGTITLVVLEVGQSSRKVALRRTGEELLHLVGPLGIPLEIDRYGTVALAAGCYGIGAILSVARALRNAGNRVVAVVEARSHYLHYYRDRLAAEVDELVQTTIDGSLGVKGHAARLIGKRLKEGEKVDRVIAVGCPFMMMLVARETAPYEVSTLAALNPIMVDGTGMCGACRITVAGEMKFACVDGPFFDAHKVDWEEVFARKAAYSAEEIHSLERTEPVAHRHG